MRLLSVLITPNPTLSPYGAERTCIELMSELTRLGVHAYTLERQPAFGRTHQLNFQSFEVPRDVFSGSLSMIRISLIALRLCLRLKCDAIYAYGDYMEKSFLPAYFASVITRKTFLTSVLDDAKRHVDSKGFFGLMKYSYRRHRRSMLGYVAFHLIRRFGFRTSCVALAATDQMANYAKEVLRARRVVVIGRGLEDVWFTPTSQTKKYDAIFVGRIHPAKGVGILLDAWSKVVSKRKESKLLVVGSGPYLPEAIEKSRRLGISENVAFEGYVSDRMSMRDLLSASKILVLPSMVEGFARVVAEGLACGLPCILSDIPVLREVYGEVGVFVPKDDSVGYSRAILTLLENDELRRIRGQKGLTFVSRFKWPVVARKMIDAMNR
ncbi:MAG: glycosyltransferase [Thaumarchaeota archaeon]|nr:glycosyltransferase [Nitrososphaerota archaeon]